MSVKFNNLFQSTSIFFLLFTVAIISCNKSDDTVELTTEPTNPETADLSQLPFGDPSILIRNQGSPQPDFLSLWLCGLPSDGAGNADAIDWTNPDGTWDYTRKPQVEGNVTWISEFNVSLDGNEIG